MAATHSRKFQLALIQLSVGKDKAVNVSRALNFVKLAKEKGAKLIALPECFNSPYGTSFFAEYAEEVPGGPTCKALSKCALDNNIYLVGGSIPERDGGKLYNTCTIWGPTGDFLGKHRKIHLFDIDIPNKITFKESDTLTAGNLLTTFKMEECTVGIGICYDLRFEEMAKLYRKKGCELMLYPGAFNTTTGPWHWELLLRARAVDNQLFVAGISPALDAEASYNAYGHSLVVDPTGTVIGQAEFTEKVIYTDIDLVKCDKFRQDVPIFGQRRTDLYDTIPVEKKSA